MKAFGVGCFNFGIRYKSEFLFDTKSHVENIELALKKITAIGELIIDYDEDLEDSAHITEAPPELNDGGNFPFVDFLRITFGLYIPSRIQSDLIGETVKYSLSGIEKFKVTMLSSYYGPVAFVECVDVLSEDCDPSAAVQVVREFLKKEFSKIDSEITFEFIGPSPFHVDFYISNKENEKIINKIELSESDQKGYNKIVFKYNEDIFETEDEALLDIYYELTDELALFYAITRENVIQMRSWINIEENLGQLNLMNQSQGYCKCLKNKYLASKLRKKIINSLYVFKAENELYQHRVDHWVKEMYDNSVVVYLKKFIETKSGRESHYPVDSVCDWMKHMEDSSMKYFEISATFSSAIIGGIIGSVVTLIWGN
jgi:hypothetical protein